MNNDTTAATASLSSRPTPLLKQPTIRCRKKTGKIGTHFWTWWPRGTHWTLNGNKIKILFLLT